MQQCAEEEIHDNQEQQLFHTGHLLAAEQPFQLLHMESKLFVTVELAGAAAPGPHDVLSVRLTEGDAGSVLKLLRTPSASPPPHTTVPCRTNRSAAEPASVLRCRINRAVGAVMSASAWNGRRTSSGAAGACCWMPRVANSSVRCTILQYALLFDAAGGPGPPASGVPRAGPGTRPVRARPAGPFSCAPPAGGWFACRALGAAPRTTGMPGVRRRGVARRCLHGSCTARLLFGACTALLKVALGRRSGKGAGLGLELNTPRLAGEMALLMLGDDGGLGAGGQVGDRDLAVLVATGAGAGTVCSLVGEEEAAGRWLVLARPGRGGTGAGGQGGPCEWTVALQSQARARARRAGRVRVRHECGCGHAAWP